MSQSHSSSDGRPGPGELDREITQLGTTAAVVLGADEAAERLRKRAELIEKTAEVNPEAFD